RPLLGGIFTLFQTCPLFPGAGSNERLPRSRAHRCCQSEKCRNSAPTHTHTQTHTNTHTHTETGAMEIGSGQSPLHTHPPTHTRSTHKKNILEALVECLLTNQ